MEKIKREMKYQRKEKIIGHFSWTHETKYR